MKKGTLILVVLLSFGLIFTGCRPEARAENGGGTPRKTTPRQVDFEAEVSERLDVTTFYADSLETDDGEKVNLWWFSAPGDAYTIALQSDEKAERSFVTVAWNGEYDDGSYDEWMYAGQDTDQWLYGTGKASKIVVTADTYEVLKKVMENGAFKKCPFEGLGVPHIHKCGNLTEECND